MQTRTKQINKAMNDDRIVHVEFWVFGGGFSFAFSKMATYMGVPCVRFRFRLSASFYGCWVPDSPTGSAASVTHSQQRPDQPIATGLSTHMDTETDGGWFGFRFSESVFVLAFRFIICDFVVWLVGGGGGLIDDKSTICMF